MKIKAEIELNPGVIIDSNSLVGADPIATTVETVMNIVSVAKSPDGKSLIVSLMCDADFEMRFAKGILSGNPNAHVIGVGFKRKTKSEEIPED
jgi:cobalamin biosynthesis protein CbiG